MRGRTVVVACACVQSIALLMMSTSRRYPTGLANSSGQLGRHFIPHFTGGIECVLEGLRGKTVTNDEGFLDHAYLPSFMHTNKRGLRAQFRRTAQLPEQAVRRMGEDRRWLRPRLQGVGEGRLSGVHAVHAVRRDAPERAVLRRSRSRADRQVRTASAPALRALGRERRGALQRHGAAGAWPCWRRPAPKSSRCPRARRPTTSWAAAGWGATRGPRSSTRDCRTHDVPNLYVVDGSVFPSASEKNPTHTIMALAARAAEHIADRMRKGDL